MSNWIKTQDQLPPHGVEVLAFLSGDDEETAEFGYCDQFVIAEYNSMNEEWESNDSAAIQDGCIPTHWQPITKP